ncbi:MAG: CHAT domain-containing protein [Actinomycetota bacterium]
MLHAKFLFAPTILSCLLLFSLRCPAQQPTPNPAIEQSANALLLGKSAAEIENLIAADKVNMSAELAAALLQKGRQFMSKNDFPSAERAFNLSLKIGEAANDKASIAVALRNLGGVSGLQGNFQKALDYFQKAVVAYENLTDDNGLAQSLRGVGNVESTFGNYDASIAAFRRGLEIYEKIGDKAGQASLNSGLSINYQRIGDFERAFEYGNRALALARESNNKPSTGMSLSNLGSLSNARGDYRSALQYHEEALKIFEETDQAERIALTLNNIGQVYLAQGDDNSAEDYFRRGLAIREKIGDRDGIARSNLRLGNLKIRQNDFPAALIFIKRSIELREGESKDPASLAEATNALGDVYFKQNDLTKAGEFYERGLKIAETIGEREILAASLVSTARFHLANNEREKAFIEANRAVEIAAQLNLRETLWEAQTIAGEIAVAANDNIRARRNFEGAIRTIEDARLFVAGGERERQQFFEGKLKPYHAIVELLIGEKKFEEAFLYAERAKARVLLDVLQTGRAQPNKAMTAAEQAQETKLRNQISAANAQLQTEAAREKPDAARLAELQKQLSKTRAALDSFTTLLYVAHPELKLQRGEANVADLAGLNKLLPDANTALLEYVVTEKSAFVFVLTKDKAKPNLQIFSIETGREELTKTVAAFREKLARRDIRFGDDAKKIYNLLLAPVLKQIAGKNRLIISPDAALWELPFQALVDKQNKYVVETAAVSYAPSLSVLTEIVNRRSAQTTESTLLAFGNSAFKTANSIGEKTARQVLLNNAFADLPEAEKQVEALSALYGAKKSKIFTGAKATETEFKKSAAGFSILHLATHGVLDDANPLYSYVLLASDAGREDGRLEAREIMQMNLNADLVVLSACETARGRIGQGEGLIGLSWSFFVAGSPTTIASLWKVESASTTETMLGFYRRIQKDSKPISKAEALRQASLALLRNEKYAHPFYWAGFVLLGDDK